MAERTTGGVRIQPHELLDRARDVSRRARRSGALVSLDTRLTTLCDGGVPFVVRVSPNLERKRAAEAAMGETPQDPLAPPFEADLYVGDVSETHAAVLNKFNVLDHHLLLVTRDHAEQTEMLDVDDYEALLVGLAGIDGLAFYNGGPEGGASQPHKHLQVVPLSLGPEGPRLPVVELLGQALAEGAAQAPGLPFRHAVAPVRAEWIEDPRRYAETAAETAASLGRALGHDSRVSRQPCPYNLLATRRLMWLVPRTRAGLPGLPVNALGFAGALLAMDQAAFEQLRRIGPMSLLTSVGEPWPHDS